MKQLSKLNRQVSPTTQQFRRKLQQVVEAAPGFQPILSYEDFLKIIESQKQVTQTDQKEVIDV